MFCVGCDNSGYRNLCNYDNEHNTCNQPPSPPLHPKSYKCVSKGYGPNGKQCVLTQSPPGPGLYTTMNDCQQHCHGGSGPPHSYGIY